MGNDSIKTLLTANSHAYFRPEFYVDGQNIATIFNENGGSLTNKDLRKALKKPKNRELAKRAMAQSKFGESENANEPLETQFTRFIKRAKGKVMDLYTLPKGRRRPIPIHGPLLAPKIIAPAVETPLPEKTSPEGLEDWRLPRPKQTGFHYLDQAYGNRDGILQHREVVDAFKEGETARELFLRFLGYDATEDDVLWLSQAYSFGQELNLMLSPISTDENSVDPKAALYIAKNAFQRVLDLHGYFKKIGDDLEKADSPMLWHFASESLLFSKLEQALAELALQVTALEIQGKNTLSELAKTNLTIDQKLPVQLDGLNYPIVAFLSLVRSYINQDSEDMKNRYALFVLSAAQRNTSPAFNEATAMLGIAIETGKEDQLLDVIKNLFVNDWPIRPVYFPTQAFDFSYKPTQEDAVLSLGVFLDHFKDSRQARFLRNHGVNVTQIVSTDFDEAFETYQKTLLRGEETILVEPDRDYMGAFQRLNLKDLKPLADNFASGFGFEIYYQYVAKLVEGHSKKKQIVERFFQTWAEETERRLTSIAYHDEVEEAEMNTGTLRQYIVEKNQNILSEIFENHLLNNKDALMVIATLYWNYDVFCDLYEENYNLTIDPNDVYGSFDRQIEHFWVSFFDFHDQNGSGIVFKFDGSDPMFRKVNGPLAIELGEPKCLESGEIIFDELAAEQRKAWRLKYLLDSQHMKVTAKKLEQKEGPPLETIGTHYTDIFDLDGKLQDQKEKVFIHFRGNVPVEFGPTWKFKLKDPKESIVEWRGDD